MVYKLVNRDLEFLTLTSENCMVGQIQKKINRLYQ